MNVQYIFTGICALTIIIMLVYYIKRTHKLISFLFGALTGLAALMIINSFGSVIGTVIPMNVFNVSGSIVLGAPFIISLVILRQL